MVNDPTRAWFAFFNEVGILAQLSRTLFEARLPQGFSLPQFTVLNHLMRVKNGQTPQALARAFQVPKTSMTHSLSVLEAAGFIAMAENPKDGRSKIVTITETGREFRENAISDLLPDVVRLARTLDPNILEYVTYRLTLVREAMDAMRD